MHRWLFFGGHFVEVMRTYSTNKQTVSHSSGLSISSQATAKLLSADVNLGEKMLYEKVNETWWKSPELTQQGFWEEVGHAKAIKHSGVHIGLLEKGLD